MFIGPDEIFSLIILLITLTLFIKAVRYNWQRWRFYERCEVTKAQVIQKNLKVLSQERSIFDKKSLRFVNNYGKVVIFDIRGIRESDSTQALHSDGVEIIYDPENPSDIQLNSFLRIWFLPLFLLLLAFIFFMSSLSTSINNGSLEELKELTAPFIYSAKMNVNITH